MAKPYLEYALLHGQATSFTRLWKNPSGESKWISVSYSPVRNEQGNVHGAVAQVTQLQDVQALEHTIIERERVLRHLTDDIDRPILYVDEGLILRFVNKPLSEIFH